MTTRSSLRHELRAARRALGRDVQKAAGRAVAARLSRERVYQRGRHIAFYLANDGELDPCPLLLRAHDEGKTCYLPVLKPGRRNLMHFVPYQPGDPLRPNRFGIPEPVDPRGRQRAVTRLDLVLAPLVGFDDAGNRIGMGGGFYDRALAGLARRRRWQRPKVIGLAHECQAVDQLPVRPWDVPLYAIATPERIIRCG